MLICGECFCMKPISDYLEEPKPSGLPDAFKVWEEQFKYVIDYILLHFHEIQTKNF